MKQFKGQLQGFPEEVVEKMLQRQEEQTGKRDISVFENCAAEGREDGGIYWFETEEGPEFWQRVINQRCFDLFFKLYPKEQTDAGEPEQKEVIVHAELEELSARYVQDCDENQNNHQWLEIFTRDNGSGKYFVLMTERWAVDDIEEMIAILRDFEKRTKQE